MLASLASSGLTVRPATPGDRPFLETLFRSARPDLQFIDAERDFVEAVIEQQHQVQQQGTGDNFPEAMHMVIEKAQHNIGALVVDFGPNEVRVLYIAFVPTARGLGYGKTILQGVQQAATQNRCPVAVTVWRSNPGAKKIYLELGFKVEESHATAERMVWYPGASLVQA
ncbi:MAG TPA: GNAT family N-acetyltransferase [Burkholderiaceae bacterium]